MTVLKEPSGDYFVNPLKNKLSKAYPEEHFIKEGHLFYIFAWEIIDKVIYLKTENLEALVKDRIRKAPELTAAIKELYPTGRGVFDEGNNYIQPKKV